MDNTDEFLLESAMQGNVGAQFYYGCTFFDSFDAITSWAYTKAKTWLNGSELQGDYMLQYDLDILCEYEPLTPCPIVPPDNQYLFGIRGAEPWIRLAARQGHARAQYELAFRSDLGDFSRCYPDEPSVWYHKAAENGVDEAQHELGACYFDGSYVSKDLKKAVILFRAAAEQGYAESQYVLGCCYRDGTGVTKDLGFAAEWFSLAQKKGHERARRELSLLCGDEDQQKKGPTLSKQWQKEVAESYRPDAMFGIGRRYRDVRAYHKTPSRQRDGFA